MNWASGVHDYKASMGKGSVAKMGGGLGPRACEVAIDIGIKAIDVGRSKDKPFIVGTIEITTNLFNCLVVHGVGIVEVMSTQVDGIHNVRLCALSKEVQLSHNGVI